MLNGQFYENRGRIFLLGAPTGSEASWGQCDRASDVCRDDTGGYRFGSGGIDRHRDSAQVHRERERAARLCRPPFVVLLNRTLEFLQY